MLELGCGDGGNLIPMALGLPGSSFVGIDTAARAIGRGQALARALELDNVTLEAGAIEDFAPAPGGFDYVIAHGVYSWVPAAVRDRLLAVCRAALAERGVAYVSYNALPGGRVREALRDMLVFHTAALDDPRERVAQARGLLRFLLEGAPERARARSGDAQPRRAAARRTATRPSSTTSSPRSTTPSTSTSSPPTPRATGCSTSPRRTSSRCRSARPPSRPRRRCSPSRTRVRREQYLDFLKARMFRQTLLCRAELAIDRTPRPEVLERLAVATQAQARGEPRRRRRPGLRGPDRLDADHRPSARHRRAAARRRRVARRAVGARPAGAAGGAGRPDCALRRPAAQLRGQPRPPPRPPAAADDDARRRPPHQRARPPPGPRRRHGDQPAPHAGAHRGRPRPPPRHAARRHPRPRRAGRRAAGLPRRARRPGPGRPDRRARPQPSGPRPHGAPPGLDRPRRWSRGRRPTGAS